MSGIVAASEVNRTRTLTGLVWTRGGCYWTVLDHERSRVAGEAWTLMEALLACVEDDVGGSRWQGDDGGDDGLLDGELEK